MLRRPSQSRLWPRMGACSSTVQAQQSRAWVLNQRCVVDATNRACFIESLSHDSEPNLQKGYGFALASCEISALAPWPHRQSGEANASSGQPAASGPCPAFLGPCSRELPVCLQRGESRSAPVAQSALRSVLVLCDCRQFVANFNLLPGF